MDYSSLPNDPDHPAGADPWQSSPQPNETPQESPDVPSSPLAKHAPATPEPEHQEDGEDGEGSYDEPLSPTIQAKPPQRNGARKISAPSQSSSSPDIRPNIRFQDQPLTEEELRHKQLYEQRQQERYQQALHAQQHQRGQPGRYHQQGTRQGQRPPQYRLQAKVTGLERTGKKDPAIRFDIHVRFEYVRVIQNRLTLNEDKSA